MNNEICVYVTQRVNTPV